MYWITKDEEEMLELWDREPIWNSEYEIWENEFQKGDHRLGSFSHWEQTAMLVPVMKSGDIRKIKRIIVEVEDE